MSIKKYKVKLEADLLKKNTVKRSNVSLEVEVNNGDFLPENFAQFVIGQKVGAGWTVLSAKVLKHTLIKAL